MKLFQALKNSFRSASDKAAESITNPVENGRFAIEDSQKQVEKYRSAIALALASNKQLERQAVAAQGTVESSQRIAAAALKANNEPDARQALENKLQAEAKVKSLQSEITKNTAMIDAQRKQLERAESKIAAAKNNQSILAARMEGAKAREGLARATSGLSTGNPLSALDDLQKAVDAAETRAEAYEDMAGVNNVPLEEKYSTANTSVDEEMEKLRASLK
jgi:phage shock protein A